MLFGGLCVWLFVGKDGVCRVLIWRQRFRDCVVAYNLFFFLRRKKKREKERPLRGLRREVSPDLLRRTEIKLKAGAQCGSAPRDPPENGQAGSGSQQRCCAQRRKFPYSGQKPFVSCPRGTTRLSLPLEGKPKKVFAAERLIT